MATLNEVAIPSTGQTLNDLLELKRLFNIMNMTIVSPYLQEGWRPPALDDPNYVPPRRDELQISIGSAVGLTAAALVVIYKIVATQQHRRTWMLFIEDWLLLLGVISAYGMLGVSWILLRKYQAGWHVYDVHIESVIGGYRLLMVTELLTAWIYSVIRISLLLSVRRLYSPMPTKMKTICDVLIFTKIACFIVSVFVIVFDVRDCPECVFDVFASMQRRAKPMETSTAVCALFLALDVLIFLSPLPLLPMLKRLSTRRKLVIFAIYFCGCCTIVASAARLWQLVYLKNIMYVDMTWYFSNLEIANNSEVVLAILTCCLPTAKSFFRWAYKKNSYPQKARASEPRSEYDAEASIRYSKGSLFTSNTNNTNPIHTEVVIEPFRVDDSGEPYSEIGMDDDENFYDMLEPSDSFFPSGNGLTPPSSRLA